MVPNIGLIRNHYQRERYRGKPGFCQDAILAKNICDYRHRPLDHWSIFVNGVKALFVDFKHCIFEELNIELRNPDDFIC